MAKVKPVTKKVLEQRAKRLAERPGSMATGICFFAMEGVDDGGLAGNRLEDKARDGDRAAAREMKRREEDKDIFFDADFDIAEGPEEPVPDRMWDPPFEGGEK